jgi:hypothetical protein
MFLLGVMREMMGVEWMDGGIETSCSGRSEGWDCDSGHEDVCVAASEMMGPMK